MIPTYILNLRSDEDRFNRLSESLLSFPWIDTTRVEGVYGSALADDVCVRLTGDPYSIVAKGALGCFLGHVRAWELIARADAPWSLILEDDAILQNWDPAAISKFPPDSDIVFANDRAQVADPSTASRGDYQLRPISEALDRIHRRDQAVGADCYFLSQNGAQGLLRAVSVDGYFSHVDMRLLAYSVELSDINSIIPGSQTAELVTHAHRVSAKPNLLRAFTVSPPLAVHMAFPETTRTREDRQGISGAPPQRD